MKLTLTSIVLFCFGIIMYGIFARWEWATLIGTFSFPALIAILVIVWIVMSAWGISSDLVDSIRERQKHNEKGE